MQTKRDKEKGNIEKLFRGGKKLSYRTSTRAGRDEWGFTALQREVSVVTHLYVVPLIRMD